MAGAAVALAVVEVVLSPPEVICVALTESVAEADTLDVIEAELSAGANAEDDDTTSLSVSEDTTDMLEDEAEVMVSSVVGGLDSVGIGTGTGAALVAGIDRVSDRVSDGLGVKDVLSTVGVEASALDSVVISLTVAVIVSAMLGKAP